MFLPNRPIFDSSVMFLTSLLMYIELPFVFSAKTLSHFSHFVAYCCDYFDVCRLLYRPARL